MTIFEERPSVLTGIILGGCLLVGLAVGGYFIGKGAARFRSETRTVTVKGLVEKEVKSDEVVWTLTLRRASNDLKDIHTQMSTDRETVVAFLKKQGFKDAEITRQPTRTIDRQAQEYSPREAPERFRYVVTSSLIVRTSNIDLVQTALGSTEELLKSGVVLDGGREGTFANPRYVVSKFNELRPQLLAEATKNARSIAQQFAADSGAQVGKIRSANQGMIQIFGSDGNDESHPFSPTSTPVKKIRVVSTFEFELR